jgi:hypothetical protein
MANVERKYNKEKRRKKKSTNRWRAISGEERSDFVGRLIGAADM